MHIETIIAEAFITFIHAFPFFKSRQLSTNHKLTLHKALVWLVMTYACPVWEFTAGTYLSKLQSLQNKVLHTMVTFQGTQ